jgi:tight adherence protein B
MLIAAGTFAIVLVLIVGIYWLVLVRPEDHAHSELRKRLKGDRKTIKMRLELVKQVEQLSDVPVLNGVLTRASGTLAPLQRLITESGVDITLGLFLLISAFAGMLMFVVVNNFVHQALIAAPAGILSATAPYMYLRYARSVRIRKFEESFPEAIDLIARALRAGHAFTTALGMVPEEIPAPVGTEFRMLYDRQNFGQPLPDAMKALADRVPLVDARFFVTAVLTQRESGGNLSEVLDNLARVIRERFKVKRQIRVITAHGRITGLVLVLLPPCMAMAMYTLGPENFSPLFTDPLGIKMVVGAAILQVVGTLIMRKLINFEY